MHLIAELEEEVTDEFDAMARAAVPAVAAPLATNPTATTPDAGVARTWHEPDVADLDEAV